MVYLEGYVCDRGYYFFVLDRFFVAFLRGEETESEANEAAKEAAKAFVFASAAFFECSGGNNRP